MAEKMIENNRVSVIGEIGSVGKPSQRTGRCNSAYGVGTSYGCP